MTELGDIKECRRLAEELGRLLEEAFACGLVPADPLAAVREDWRRLARWSDGVQDFLRGWDGLLEESEAKLPFAGRGKSRALCPGRQWLEGRQRLLRELPDVMEAARRRWIGDLRPDDWPGGRPHPQVVEVGEVVDPGTALKWAGPAPAGGAPVGRAQVLGASHRAAQPGSTELQARQARARQCAARVAEALVRHREQEENLDRVRHWLDQGELSAARKALAASTPAFADLDYERIGSQVAAAEKEVEQDAKEAEEALGAAESVEAAARSFRALPRLSDVKGAQRQQAALVALLETLEPKAARCPAGETQGRYRGLMTRLEQKQNSLSRDVLPRLRKWNAILACGWLAVFVAVGAFAKKSHDEAQRVAAAKAKAEAEAKAKAEAERVAAAKLTRLRAEGKPWVVEQIGLAMVALPAGHFQMGSQNGDSDERPVTEVALKEFWLAQTEVTQAQYRAVMGDSPSRFKGDLLPVENVSWEDAREFCAKLTQRERAAGRLPDGMAYTLPTEAQWEYACRAGSTGDYAGRLDDLGWYSSNSGSGTHPVAGKAPNAWGLYDMHGNVWEWCADLYGSLPGGQVQDPRGSSSGSYRVRRGGCWDDKAGDCRSAIRSGSRRFARGGDLGFRPALSSVP